jgi:cytochrome c oxidase subunit 3
VLEPIAGIPGIKPEPQRSLPWLTITLILGNGFLIGQAFAWMALQQHGVFLASNPSSSFFYLLTGTHAVHLGIGIFALLFAALTHLFSRRLELKCLVVDVTSWYWHFMGVLWIYILGLLYFMR